MRRLSWLVLCLTLAPAAAAAQAVPGPPGAGPSKAPKRLRVAVMELRPIGVEQAKVDVLSEVALTEAAGFARLETIGGSDVTALLSFEQQRRAMGCTEDSACLAEVGGALGVDYLLIGSLGRLGDTYRLDLKVVDPRKARVLGRFGESVAGEEGKLVAAAQRAVRQLLGPLAGVEPQPAQAQAPAPAMSAAPPSAPATTGVAPASRFDGAWSVVVTCPDDGGAKGYTLEFPARIAGGELTGQHGTEGAPRWLRLEGRIGAAGDALLDASGRTGAAEYSVQRSTPGTAYGYRVKARFEADRGTGERQEQRPCRFTFSRRPAP